MINKKWTTKEALIGFAAIVFTLVLHQAIPFFTVPTLGQAVWSMGFANSISHGSILNLYAHDFGIPQPAAISFGLSGVLPASLLMRLGMYSADAYSAMVAFWLIVAFVSAFNISRMFGAGRPASSLVSVLWMSAPIIWAHGDYSMLSLGIALLSFYFLATFKLFLFYTRNNDITVSTVALYLAAAIVAVFMDGYSFMMFATGASILWVYSVFSARSKRLKLIQVALPIHLASFALAYFLYISYIGVSSFPLPEIAFFRGWGLDLSFLIIPTRGVLWLPDLLGISMARSNQLYFGDSSVWKTTFALPLILVALVACWKSKNQIKIVFGIMLIALFGFYMSLGPSLKVNSTKPHSLQLSKPGQQSALMPAKLALMPTGNAWLSERLPGFDSMRASYRWSALWMFALWLLVAFSLARKELNLFSTLGVFLLIALNLPNVPQKLRLAADNRGMFRQIDLSIVSSLKRQTKPGETIVFAPWGNDFLVNYLAPKVGFRTFNIGGDKNLYLAQKKWPHEILDLGFNLTVNSVPAMLDTLSKGKANAVIIPYFNTLWSAHIWPCPEESIVKYSKIQLENLRKIPGFICPSKRKIQVNALIHALQALPYLEVHDGKLFAIVRLQPDLANLANSDVLNSKLLRYINYPISLDKQSVSSKFILKEGWNELEGGHVWSKKLSKLILPVPAVCESKQCNAIVTFNVFGASQSRPVSIHFASEFNPPLSKTIVISSGDNVQVTLPLSNKSGFQIFTISVPKASSPQKLYGSKDMRILGLGLQHIDLGVI